MQKTAQTFQLPEKLSADEQVRFCLRVLQQYRDELSPLRKERVTCQTYHSDIIDQIREWKEKYQKKEEELKKVEKENEQLKKEIEKLTKTNQRYRVALFDHGNFKKQDPQKEKKNKGGQPGHKDTNKDSTRDYASFARERIFAEACGNCGNPVARANGIRAKTLIDIQINTELIQRIMQAERQWCSNCQKEVRVAHPQSLPFTEYGLNTFMVVMYLRHKGKQSIGCIALTLQNIFALPISKSGVNELLSQAKKYLEGKYEVLKEAIRKGEIMYNDETGWHVRGKPAWIWIMATQDKKMPDGSIQAGMTVYVPAESRGKGIFKEMYGNSKAKSMHDGYSSYEAITGIENTLYCWAHVLRFAFEETVKLEPAHRACQIRNSLVRLYQTIREQWQWTKEEKETTLREALAAIIAISSKDEAVRHIVHRVTTQKEGLIQALLITQDGTNNLAEREFRGLAISRRISYGSDTYAGMERTAILASIVQTITRDKTKQFLPTLSELLRKGIQKQKKYSQYSHVPHF